MRQATDAARTVMAKLSTDLGATAGTAVQTLRGLVTEVSPPPCKVSFAGTTPWLQARCGGLAIHRLHHHPELPANALRHAREVSSGDKVQEATAALSKIFMQDQEARGGSGNRCAQRVKLRP